MKNKKVVKESHNVENLELIARICQASLVANESGWWLDTGATIHICKDRSLFKTYYELAGMKKCTWQTTIAPRWLAKA